MAPRPRQSAGQSVTAAQDDGPYNIPGLEFNQALTWRAGKALPVADLLSRLQTLGEELRGLEQNQIEGKQLRKLAQDLAHSNLLGHKDKGVRAWALCCVVDILNICVPHAPYNTSQLRDIFKVVNNLLPNLGDPSNAYNSQHIYILNSLTDTKSIMLIGDLERSEELTTPLFRICFDIVSGATQNTSGQELAKSVEYQLRAMLICVIEDASIGQETVDVILSQFLRVDPRAQQEPIAKGKKQDVKDKKQDTLLLKDYPPAYNMAKSILTSCTEKMLAHVSQYVGNIIMNASAALNDEPPMKQHGRKNSEVDDLHDIDESLSDLRKAHRLVRELWRACPDVLHNVIPQVEAELFADSPSIRQLATETLGDIIAGIGISGPPPTSTLDPAAYPLPSVEEPEIRPVLLSPLLVPASPKPFASVYQSAYTAFMGRRIDKSPAVRNAWTIAVGRILLTDAGGIGISYEDRQALLSGYTGMLRDVEDKVRLTAVHQIADFSYHAVVDVLGADGGLSSTGSLLSTLADRIIDRRHAVREEAMSLLGKMWGTGSRDILNSVGKVVNVLGDIPSRICNSMYVNDMHIHMQLDKTLYESLIPITFPSTKTGKGENQKRGKSKTQDSSNIDMDHIRVLRILAFIRSLDPKARQIFFGIQKRQVEMSKVMKVFLEACEKYNGGVVDDAGLEKQLRYRLTKYVQAIVKQYPEPVKATSDFWKFIETHDRRNYQLIRFATEPEYDYRTMSKAIKELTKRIKESNPSIQAIMDTLLRLLHRSALVVYNRSHGPAIMDISHTNEDDLAETAHELLKEMSARNPEVLKTHIQTLCNELQDNAPSASITEPTSAADTLKACTGFARKYPAEVPKHRQFLTAMMNFALYSTSPKAAKHATTIVMAVSTKKELHAKEIISKAVEDCTPESSHYLARLATIAQICLLSPSAAMAEEDAILEIAVINCLQKNRSPDTRSDPNAWESPPSDETKAKELALRIMVNRCRSADDKSDQSSFDLLAKNVLAILMQLIQNDGEITKTDDTPSAQRNRLRLAAAHFVVKLCSHKRRCEDLITPKMFIDLALIVINPPYAVRSGLVQQLQKYFSRGHLHQRWYTIFFLIAFEPDVELKARTLAWVKSRVSFYSRQQKAAGSVQNERAVSQQTVMENAFTRLLSLLAHHPDYPDPESAEFDVELLDFAKYIVFYLQCVATEENLSLIFHIAQRVKQTRDAVSNTDEGSERLYVLSDLAQAVIRNFADLMPAHAKGVNLLQTWPGKVALPTSLFSALPSSAVAQEIAAKNYLPEDVAMGLEKIVRGMVRGAKSREKSKPTAGAERKRKSDSVDPDDSDVEKKVKKVRKSSTLPIRKPPKVSKRKSRDGEEASTEQPSRKSARTSAVKTYAESDSDEDEVMDDAVKSSLVKSALKSSMSKQIVTPTDELADGSEVEDDRGEDTQMEEDANDDVAHDEEAEEEPQASAAGSDPDDDDQNGTNGDQIGSDEGEDEAEVNDDEEGGTPLPSQKPARKTRSAPTTKTNGASTAKSKAKAPSKAQTNAAEETSRTKKVSKNAVDVVSKLNASAGIKGKSKKTVETTVETSPATGMRRSARTAK